MRRGPLVLSLVALILGLWIPPHDETSLFGIKLMIAAIWLAVIGTH